MRSTRRIVAVLAALGIVLVGLVVATAPVEAKDKHKDDKDKGCSRTNNSVRKLLECVTLKGVLEHEPAFAGDRR